MSSQPLKRAGFVTIAAALSLGAIAGASAETNDLKVRYHSYELETYGAAGALYRRIERKVRNYCEAPGIRTLNQHTAEKACRDEMLHKVVKSFDSGKLNAIHEQRTDGTRVANR